MNNISVIGIGKLGLCFSLTMEKAGYNILGVDVSQEYVNAINNKTFHSDEEGVNKHLGEAINFEATTDLTKALEFSDFLYVVVATPSLVNGEYNHSYVDGVVDNVIKHGIQKTKKCQDGCITAEEELPSSFLIVTV